MHVRACGSRPAQMGSGAVGACYACLSCGRCVQPRSHALSSERRRGSRCGSLRYDRRGRIVAGSTRLSTRRTPSRPDMARQRRRVRGCAAADRDTRHHDRLMRHQVERVARTLHAACAACAATRERDAGTVRSTQGGHAHGRQHLAVSDQRQMQARGPCGRLGASLLSLREFECQVSACTRARVQASKQA